ncbi:MAG: hypothetical protein OXG61_04200 [Chloroflexi bacterium]|nr:hypothetical protein [Chloroflexota bacterium]
MSKLSEALQRKRRGESARVMGFGAPATGKDRALLLGVTGVSASDAAEALEAGADFAAVAADDTEGAVAALDGIDGLLGAQIGSLEADGIEALEEAGADFVIAAPDEAAAGIVDSEVGLVLAANEAWEDAPLRALAPLSLDAVLVREPVEGFTVARRISLARVAALCGAPLIVAVGPDVSTADLAALRESGAGGVVGPADELAGIIEQLEAVPLRSPKRRGEGGGFAIVPPGSAAGDGEEIEDDD